MNDDTLKTGCVVGVLGLGFLAWWGWPWSLFLVLGMFAIGIGGLVYSSKFSLKAKQESALRAGHVGETLSAMFEAGQQQQVISFLRSQSTLRLPAGIARDKMLLAARGLFKVQQSARSTANKYIPSEIKDDAVRQCIGSSQALFNLCERLTLVAQLGTDTKEFAPRFAEVNRGFEAMAATTDGVLTQFSKLTLGANNDAIDQARKDVESVGWQASEMNKLEQILSA